METDRNYSTGTRRTPVPLVRKRSLSTPQTAECYNNILKLRPFYHMDSQSKYNWVDRDQLISILDKHNVKKESKRGVPQETHTGAVKPIRSRKKGDLVISPSSFLLHAYWSTKKDVPPSTSLLKDVLPLVGYPKQTRWMFYVMGMLSFSSFLRIVMVNVINCFLVF